MKIEDQVCTLEQAKALKEFGVPQETVFYFSLRLGEMKVHHEEEYNRWAHQYKENMLKEGEHYSAYSVAELGVMLPEGFTSYYSSHLGRWLWQCVEPTDENDFGWKVTHADGGEYDTEAEARAEALIYCYEKKVEGINNHCLLEGE